MSIYADRVKQSVTSPGSGTVTLSGSASTGYQTFLNAFGSGSTVVAYCIADQAGNSWEVGTGTYNGTANTLTRSSVFASSNSNSLVNFSSGIQDVFCTAPAKYLDVFTATNQGTVPASGGGNGFLRADGVWTSPAASMAMDGADGEDGMPGPSGIAGATGSAGATGATGSQGAAGVSGEDGIDGDAGPPGLQGATGATGSTGAIGPFGPMGMMGEDGTDGDIGPPGIAGSAGAVGMNGQIGPTGEDGSDADAFLIGIPTLQAAGSTTQIQFNNAGAFGADANFTYTSGTTTLTVGTLTSPSGALNITPFAPAAGTAPAPLQITGAASLDANNGGAININGGNALSPSTGVGGLLVLKAGGSVLAPGGGLSMTGGTGTSGGGFVMTSGAGSSAASGGFTIGSGGGGFGSGNFSFGTAGGGSGGNSGNQSFSTGSSSFLSGTTGSFNFTTGVQTNGGTSGSFNVNLGTSATGTGGSIILRPGSGATKGSTRLRSSLATDVIQITDNGTNQIGFFGATPVVKQTTGGTPTGSYTLNDVIAALQAYGLLV